MVDLSKFDIVLVNSSAGKDSQAMLTVINEMAVEQGVQDRIVVVHSDLGRVEWEGVRELAEEQARHYGNRFEVVSRPQGDLLDHVEQRRMWPSSNARYCTSDHKRGQIYKVMTKLVTEMSLARPVKILNCLGIRAQESPARAKKNPFQHDGSASNGKRDVTTWYPIFDWTVEQVWETIYRSGVRWHWAYDAGMSRLSCVFCVFASRKDLLIAARHNPNLLEQYVAVENRISHTFRKDLSLVQIKAAVTDDSVASTMLSMRDLPCAA